MLAWAEEGVGGQHPAAAVLRPSGGVHGASFLLSSSRGHFMISLGFRSTPAARTAPGEPVRELRLVRSHPAPSSPLPARPHPRIGVKMPVHRAALAILAALAVAVASAAAAAPPTSPPASHSGEVGAAALHWTLMLKLLDGSRRPRHRCRPAPLPRWVLPLCTSRASWCCSAQHRAPPGVQPAPTRLQTPAPPPHFPSRRSPAGCWQAAAHLPTAPRKPPTRRLPPRPTLPASPVW